MDAESLLEDAAAERRARERRAPAEAALRAASEAVAKAREEVVEAAKRQLLSWQRAAGTVAGDEYDDCIDRTEEAAEVLLEAERAEAEARARLEALR